MSNLEFTKEQLDQENLRRDKEKTDKLQEDFSPYAKDGFWKFCQYMAPEFYTDAKTPLKELCAVFQRVTLGELKKVLISFFPRGGKSRTTGLWIIWDLGYNPEGSFMRNCYNDTLAADLSKSTMDSLASDAYALVFPNVKLDNASRAKMNWQLAGTSITTYFGAGMNGTITGKGCNRAAIFDDPIKNPEEAMSEAYLEKIDTFIEYALTTRVEANSNCAEIIISTRWCDGDPIGLRENDPDWHKFIFPVLGEDEKSVCEEMFSTDKAIKVRDGWIKKARKWMWDALYMCIPSDASFAKLSLDTLKRFSMKDLEGKTPDEILAWCDYANKGSDNLSSPFCYRFGNKKFIVGAVFSNEDSIKLEKPLIEKIVRFKPEEFTFESQAGGIEFGTNLQRNYELIFDALNLDIDFATATTNKEIRIMLRLGEIKEDCYFLVDEEQDEHYKRFMTNLTGYGKYKNSKDDAADSMAGLLSMMSEVGDVEVECISSNNILDIKNPRVFTEPNIETEDESDDSEDSDVMIF